MSEQKVDKSELLNATDTDDEDIPENFAEQIASRIVTLHEKDLDPTVSSANIASFVYEVTNDTKLMSYFTDALELFLEDDSTAKFAALAVASLMMHSETHAEYDVYINNFCAHVLENYYNMAKPEVQLKKMKYSAYSHILGGIFIKMIEINNAMYDVIQDLYSRMIRLEMQQEANEMEKGTDKKMVLLKKSTKKKTISKKLYDDVVDMIAAKGDFKSTSLNQENPNEHVSILADRLRGTRRYVIQDIMNKRALDRKKRLEKEMSEQLASAEEVILAAEPFKQGLALFWREKRYNYKFLAVEKIRVALQIIGVIIGSVYSMAGYLSIWGVHWVEGIIVCMGMILFIKFAGSRKQFKSFYPYDVSKELEQCVNNFTNILRKMSKEQMSAFLNRQIKDKHNYAVVQVIPEFVKYLYAVMPDRKNMILTVDQLSDLMENLEIDIAKELRGRV